MSNATNFFKGLLWVMLFYSFVITMLAYSIPEDAKKYITGFSDLNSDIDFETIGSEVEESLQRQTNIPVIEMGALVFYSGNIFLDLILNFLFAFPEILGLLVNGIMLLFSVDTYLFAVVESFSIAAVTIFYMIGLIQMILGLRSGQSGGVI